MTLRDSLGNTVSGASAEAVAAYENVLHEFQCYIGDPAATIGQALADSPGFVMAHAMHAYLHLLGTEPDGVPPARAAYATARKLPMTVRERGHVDAVGHLLEGYWHFAGRVLEDVAADNHLYARARTGGDR